MVTKKLRVKKSEAEELNMAKIAQGLGAKIVNIPEMSKEESADYIPVGSLVMVPEADKPSIYYFGSRMLEREQKSLDQVVGYRVLGQDEEPEFRKQLGYKSAIVVRYYGNK